MLPTSSLTDIETVISSLSDSQVEILLRAHVQKAREQIAEREAELEPILGTFLDKIGAAYERGAFPVSREQAEERLRDVTISFFDPWNFVWPTDEGYVSPDGLSSQQVRGVLLNVELDTTQLQFVADHELLHLLSTVIAQVEYQEKPDADTDELDYFIQHHNPIVKSGVRILPDYSLNRMERFNWLSEAIIESETMALNETDESKKYPNWRGVLSRLEQRVDRNLFLVAQFEDYERQTGTPAWGELNRQINKRFEPHLLLTLDKLFEEQGTDAAVEYMDTHFPEAPAA